MKIEALPQFKKVPFSSLNMKDVFKLEINDGVFLATVCKVFLMDNKWVYEVEVNDVPTQRYQLTVENGVDVEVEKKMY